MGVANLSLSLAPLNNGNDDGSSNNAHLEGMRAPSDVSLAREPTPVEDLMPNKAMGADDFLPPRGSKPMLYEAVLTGAGMLEWQYMGVYDDDDLIDVS